MSALPAVPTSVGVSRIVRGIRVEHVCGNPRLSPQDDAAFGTTIVKKALQSLTTGVEEPTLFDPLN